MKLFELKDKLALEVLNLEGVEDREVEGIYAGDLLSWVMGHAKEHQAWLSVQTHDNVIAVALLKELSCIIFVEGAEVPPETIDKAKSNNLALFRTDKSAYEVCADYSKQ